MSSLRDGPFRNRNRSQWLRFAVLITALLAVLFVASGAASLHVDAPGSEATCPICHAVHMPALRGAPAEALASFETVARLVVPEARLTQAVPAALHAPPRAPPV